MRGLLEGQLALQRQVETNLEELCLSAYRRHIPIYHTEHAYTLFLDPKERNATPAAFVRFGAPGAFYLSPPTNPSGWLTVCDRYGVPNDSACWYQLPLCSVVSVEKITDHPTNPTIELFPNKDFEIYQDAVRFFQDPCLDGKSKELFLINVKQDFKWIYKHFGYLLSLESRSSKSYRNIIDGIFNAYIGGCSAVDVFSVLAEVTGNIIAKESETVTEVTSSEIVTDKNSYELLPDHLPRVKVGETIAPCDSLTKEFTIIPINQLTPKEELPAVLIPKRYLGSDYFYGLVFVNRDVPVVTVRVEIDGKTVTQSRFHIGGNRSDVERFWSDFERQCKRHGTTVNAVVQLCRDNSTDGINPYKFFTEHIGRYNYTLLAVDHRPYPTDLRLDQIPLRRLLPPWSTVIVQQRLDIDHTVSAVGQSNDEITIGVRTDMEGSYSIQARNKIYLSRVA